MNEQGQKKAGLRKDFRSLLTGIRPEQKASDSEALVERISLERRWREARTVMLFIPLADEPDVLPLVAQALDHHKWVVLPRFNAESEAYEGARVSNLSTDLVRGRFGVTEPGPGCPVCPLKQLDVTLVPGLGFDRVGRRLGRGKGFYDRLLAGASGVFWGVGYDLQLVAELPGEPHDVVLNCIVTPAHWLEVVSARR